MKTTLRVDFGRTACDYGRWRAGFPDEFYQRLLAFGVGTPGQDVLDIGAGTGAVAREMAHRGCRVTALDRAHELLTEGRRLARDAGPDLAWIRALAEALPVRRASHDVVTAAQ